MVSSKRLLWSPAHLTQRSIGQLANGTNRVISAADWRANRLADALAKEAANQLAIPKSTVNLVKDAEEAARYYMALIGTVTHAANNCRTQVMVNGELTWVSKRDSLERPKAATAAQKRARTPKPRCRPETALTPEEVASSQPAAAPSVHCTASKQRAAKRKHATEAAETERAATARAVTQLAERLLPSTASPTSASDRLSALRSRIREREQRS
jgi:hypothetical protein